MKLTKEVVCAALEKEFFLTKGNVIPPEIALPGCEKLTVFEVPLIGFADADDPLFESFHHPDIIGPPYLSPKEWLADARTVISFFLPFTEAVRRANRGGEETASAWLHGRVEGQDFITNYTERLGDWFSAQGINVCVPASDARFVALMQSVPDEETGQPGLRVSSAWSERHAAYVAGLGTFSLTRGLITEKGVAGRYGSIIISERIEPDVRPYSGIYDYCTRCGACVKKCPAGAVSLEYGKNQLLCSEWVSRTKEKYAPRYGCGKCQVGVPCESRNPSNCC